MHLNTIGHKIILCTGRPLRRTLKYYDELQLNTPIVNYHGAYIHSPKENSFKEKVITIDVNRVNEIIETSINYGIENIILEYGNDEILFLENDEALKNEFFDINNIKLFSKDTIVKNPINIIIHPNKNNYLNYKALLKEVFGNLNVIQWGEPWNLIEIINPKVNKAIALDYICKKFGIAQNRVIAFGDAENDIDMLKFAEFGIAMDNASFDVKEVANSIIGNNNSNGIAKYLKNFFNIQQSIV